MTNSQFKIIASLIGMTYIGMFLSAFFIIESINSSNISSLFYCKMMIGITLLFAIITGSNFIPRKK